MGSATLMATASGSGTRMYIKLQLLLVMHNEPLLRQQKRDAVIPVKCRRSITSLLPRPHSIMPAAMDMLPLSAERADMRGRLGRQACNSPRVSPSRFLPPATVLTLSPCNLMCMVIYVLVNIKTTKHVQRMIISQSFRKQVMPRNTN